MRDGVVMCVEWMSLCEPVGAMKPFFFFKQKTAYEIGLGIPAEPLFRSFFDSSEISDIVNFCVMEAIKLCRLDTPIIFIEARINLSRFVVTGCAAKTSATVTFPSLNLISLFAFCFSIWLNGVASKPSLVSWIKHSVDSFGIVSIFIPKLRLILILNSFLGSSDSLVFSELFHSLSPRPLAARSISDFVLTYLAT